MESWKWDKDFMGPNDIVVRVNELPLYQPKYSFELGVIVNGVLRRHLPGDLDPDTTFKIGELIMEAQHYISEKLMARAQEIRDKAEEDRKREEDKRKRHGDNRDRRREENRQRTNAAKGGGKRAS